MEQKEIIRCRLCGNKELMPIVNLGELYLGGRFPKEVYEEVPKGPLEVVKCFGDIACGLVQLRHTMDMQEMYGKSYGYMSSLNKSMVRHLENIARALSGKVQLYKDDIVLDIGSNDGTLLRSYNRDDIVKIGIDSCGKKFRPYYDNSGIDFISGFFNKGMIEDRIDSKKVKIVTTIAMFYDLESPLEFMQDIADILDDNGIWFMEQSYMPTMLYNSDYTTICHEHLEYYALKQIAFMARQVGLKIIDVQFNFINGGSFALTLTKKGSYFREDAENVARILHNENYYRGLDGETPYIEFRDRAMEHREKMQELLVKYKNEGRRILGYGASTKGNTMLQFCEIDKELLSHIAEVNIEKFWCYTPGTLIPIIPEQAARKMRPNYFLVLPWHFKKSIIEREQKYLKGGGKLIFPFPSKIKCPVDIYGM